MIASKLLICYIIYPKYIISMLIWKFTYQLYTSYIIYIYQLITSYVIISYSLYQLYIPVAMLCYYKLLICYIIYPSISYIWVNYNISPTWNKAILGMIPLTNHDFQWGRSEVVIIYADYIPKYIIYPKWYPHFFTPKTKATKAIKARREDFSAPLDEILAPGDPPAGAKKMEENLENLRWIIGKS